MGLPRIGYNSKTIALPDRPFVHRVTPIVARKSNTTLTGAVDTLLAPRMDIQVHLEFRTIDDASVRVQMDNFWQWASQGNDWNITLDTARTIDVLTTSNLAAGVTTIPLSSVSGITAGYVYKMISGANYQLVLVDSVGASSVVIHSALDTAFGSGALFRDQFYFPAIIRDDSAADPIQDVVSTAPDYQNWPPKRFGLVLDFYEDVV